MGTVSPPTVAEPRRVPLNGVEYLMVGAERGGVAAAYYRLRRPGEPKDLPAMRRFANRRATLESVLDAVFQDGDARHHAATTAAYIRALPWGAELP